MNEGMEAEENEKAGGIREKRKVGGGKRGRKGGEDDKNLKIVTGGV